jgi:hypothetical protein
MAIDEFARKHLSTARAQGLRPAVRAAAWETAAKVAGAAVSRRARSIWDSDWEVCLVLDACRADLWAEVAPRWLGRSTAYSVGGCSPEWIDRTFSADYDLEGVGYVTANPFSSKGPDGLGAVRDGSAYPLRDRGLAYLDEVYADRWNPDGRLPTVTPADVTARARWAWNRRDELGIEQLVVHYMQPHIPFRSRPEWCHGWDLDGFGTGGGYFKDTWKKIRDGELQADAVWAAYADNLRWAIDDAVTPWVTGSDASLLVTSDHGNAMGEWGEWGHPIRSNNPAVREVPWVRTVGLEDRPVGDVPGDPPARYASGSGETVVEDQLAALGYAEA